MIPWLDPDGPPGFPLPQRALDDPNGLLAAGGALSPDWLRLAYRHGIFPWFNRGDPILWWSPDPRMALDPAAAHISRSLRRRLNSGAFSLTLDRAFAQVVDACAAPRDYADDTWIVPAMREAYVALHAAGDAHSIEVWQDGDLVGGLYGVALGRAFFGESMFHRATDASKVAFVQLCRQLARWGFGLLDAQLPNPHLATLGALETPRAAFLTSLPRLVDGPCPANTDSSGRWQLDADLAAPGGSA